MENTSTKIWIRFKDQFPKLNDTIDIYWSTGEVTENTTWQNDVVWCSNEIPVFWSKVI